MSRSSPFLTALNAIVLPSGDHCGVLTSGRRPGIAKLVRWPVRSTVPAFVRLAYASCAESGDHEKLAVPLTYLNGSNVRVRPPAAGTISSPAREKNAIQRPFGANAGQSPLTCSERTGPPAVARATIVWFFGHFGAPGPRRTRAKTSCLPSGEKLGSLSSMLFGRGTPRTKPPDDASRFVA